MKNVVKELSEKVFKLSNDINELHVEFTRLMRPDQHYLQILLVIQPPNAHTTPLNCYLKLSTWILA